MTTDISIYLSGDPPSPNRTFIADSGATITIANSTASFSSLAALPIPLRLMGISGPQGLFATHRGTLHEGIDAFLSPKMAVSVLSTGSLSDAFGGGVSFDSHAATWHSLPHGQVHLATRGTDKHYHVNRANLRAAIDTLRRDLADTTAAYAAAQADILMTAIRFPGPGRHANRLPVPDDRLVQATHEILLHMPVSQMLLLHKRGRLPKAITANMLRDFVCPLCLHGQLRRTPTPRRSLAERIAHKRKMRPGQEMFTDDKGPMPPSFEQHYRYFKLLMDTCTDLWHVIPMKSKRDSARALETGLVPFLARLQRADSGRTRQRFRLYTDHDTTLSTEAVKLALARRKVELLFIATDSHVANHAESGIAALVRKASLLLNAAHLSGALWPMAVQAATDAHNEAPNKRNPGSKSPSEMCGEPPRYGDRSAFGAHGFIAHQRESPDAHAFDPGTHPAIYLGLGDDRKSALCLDLSTLKLRQVRHAYFQDLTGHLDRHRIPRAIARQGLLATGSAAPTTEPMTTPPHAPSVDADRDALPIPAAHSAAPRGRCPKGYYWDRTRGEFIHRDSGQPYGTPVLDQLLELPPDSERPRRMLVCLSDILDTPDPGAQPGPPDPHHLLHLLGRQATDIAIPSSGAAAMLGPDAAPWWRAMLKQVKRLVRFGVASADRREIAKRLRLGARPTPTTWVLTVKEDMRTGEAIRLKARCCICGNRENQANLQGTVQAATGSVATALAQRMIIINAVQHNRDPFTIDFVNAYSHAEETTPRLVRLTPLLRRLFARAGMPIPDDIDCLAVLMAWYGFDDAGGKYQRLLVMVLVHDLGFEQYPKDPCLFRRVTVDPPSITLVSTHSDDLGASASSPAAKQYLITGLRRHFDLTVDDYSSHIGVVHTRLPNGGFDLSMPSKVAQLDRLVPSTGRTVRTPFPTSCDLTPPPDREGDSSARGGALRGGDATPPPPRGGGAHAQPAPATRPGTAPDSATTAAAATPPFHYNQVLGLVMWITFKVNIDLSRHVIGLAVYQAAPFPAAYTALRHLARFIVDNPAVLRIAPRDRSDSHPSTGTDIIEGYCDSDLGGCPKTRRSYSGVHIEMHGMTLQSFSARQTRVTTAVGIAELYALHEAAHACIIASEMAAFVEPRYVPKQVPIHCDNDGVVKTAIKQNIPKRIRHVELHYFEILDQTATGIITVLKCAGADNPSDVLTKPSIRGMTHKAAAARIGVIYQ